MLEDPLISENCPLEENASHHKSISQNVQDSLRIVALVKPMRSDSGPGVDTVGIYSENHDNECREFFIWIRFDNRKSDEKGALPLLLEDFLILQLCPLEESASHHHGCRDLLEDRFSSLETNDS